MALAWNAGWVNSPQGFKSPILRFEGPGRTQSGRGLPHIRSRPGAVQCAGYLVESGFQQAQAVVWVRERGGVGEAGRSVLKTTA